MRALHVVERDGGYVAELREVATPVPGAGEVLLRVLASGVNRADLSQIAGRYPSPPGEPEGIGLEVSGTIEGTSERVAALLAGGGHAEYVAVPRGQTFPVPAGLDAIAAAAMTIEVATTATAVTPRARPERGGRVRISPRRLVISSGCAGCDSILDSILVDTVTGPRR